MNGVPLHPMVVHLPLALCVLLPFFAAGAWWLARRSQRPGRTWLLPVLLAGLLTGSAFVALRTGQAQEDRVEHVVGEAPLHEHEEAAERFLLLSVALLAVLAAGLLPGRTGSSARVLGTLGTLALVAAGVQVGQAGGELVYRHGAASAYTNAAPDSTPLPIDAADSDHPD